MNPIARVVNRRAQRRYTTFWACLLQVHGAMEDARKVTARLVDSGRQPFWVATSADLAKAANRVDTALRTLSKSGKRWEAELISREWRR